MLREQVAKWRTDSAAGEGEGMGEARGAVGEDKDNSGRASEQEREAQMTAALINREPGPSLPLRTTREEVLLPEVRL